LNAREIASVFAGFSAPAGFCKVKSVKTLWGLFSRWTLCRMRHNARLLNNVSDHGNLNKFEQMPTPSSFIIAASSIKIVSGGK